MLRVLFLLDGMILRPPRLALLVLGVIAPGVDGCNYCGGGNSGCGGNLCIGEGDCDRDSDCATGLRCGTDNCNAFRSPAGWSEDWSVGWDTTDDCCYDPSCGYGYCPGEVPAATDSCQPNPFLCDSSRDGDCCTARDTSFEDRRCRDGWIPIYTGVGCGLPPHENEGNMFTCYPPTCSALPEDNCGPNSCYDGEEIAKVVIIVIAVIATLAIIGTLGGVYGCYKGKCCCFRQPKPPQPMGQSVVAQPVIPMVQPATMAYQAQPVAQQTQPGMTKVV